jgi:hypothetical protein
MARHRTPRPDDDIVTEAAKKVNDPGGSHTKGYTAETGPEPAVPAEGPLPLAPDAPGPGAIHQPEREGKVSPTGRSAPGPDDLPIPE